MYVVIFRERLYSIRAFILPIIGACIAYGYVFAGFYLLDQTDKTQDFFDMIRMQINGIQFFTFIEWKPIFIFFGAVSVLLGCISFFHILWKLQSIVINKRRKHIILLIILLLQLIFMLFFHPQYYHLLNQIMIILLTIAISLSMSYAKKKILYNIIFFVLFISAVVSFLINL